MKKGLFLCVCFFIAFSFLGYLGHGRSMNSDEKCM